MVVGVRDVEFLFCVVEGFVVVKVLVEVVCCVGFKFMCDQVCCELVYLCNFDVGGGFMVDFFDCMCLGLYYVELGVVGLNGLVIQ